MEARGRHLQHHFKNTCADGRWDDTAGCAKGADLYRNIYDVQLWVDMPERLRFPYNVKSAVKGTANKTLARNNVASNTVSGCGKHRARPYYGQNVRASRLPDHTYAHGCIYQVTGRYCGIGENEAISMHPERCAGRYASSTRSHFCLPLKQAPSPGLYRCLPLGAASTR